MFLHSWFNSLPKNMWLVLDVKFGLFIECQDQRAFSLYPNVYQLNTVNVKTDPICGFTVFFGKPTFSAFLIFFSYTSLVYYFAFFFHCQIRRFQCLKCWDSCGNFFFWFCSTKKFCCPYEEYSFFQGDICWNFTSRILQKDLSLHLSLRQKKKLKKENNVDPKCFFCSSSQLATENEDLPLLFHFCLNILVRTCNVTKL